MHEYSVVQALLEQTETIAKEHEAGSITKVAVSIGVMSGVEPHLLEIAFHTFKEQTLCEGAEFEMRIQPLVIICRECAKESTLEEICYCCPVCESLDVQVTQGEDMLLMRLEME